MDIRVLVDACRWMEDEFQMRLNEYRTQVGEFDSSEADQYAPPEGAAGVAQSEGGSTAAEAENGDGIEAEDLLGRLSRFMEGSAGLSGAKPQPSSFSLDVNALMALLKPPGAQNSSCREGLDEEADDFRVERRFEHGSEGSDSDDDSESVPDATVAAQNTCTKNTTTPEFSLDAPEAVGSNAAQGGADARCVLRAGDKHDTGARGSQGHSEQNEAGTQPPDDGFMADYMQHLDEELNENVTGKLNGVNVDMGCVADLLKSVEESAGQPGAADGLIGMLGMRLPKS